MNTAVRAVLLLLPVTLFSSHAAAVRVVTPEVAIVDIDNEVHGVKAMPTGVVVPPDGVLSRS